MAGQPIQSGGRSGRRQCAVDVTSCASAYKSTPVSVNILNNHFHAVRRSRPKQWRSMCWQSLGAAHPMLLPRFTNLCCAPLQAWCSSLHVRLHLRPHASQCRALHITCWRCCWRRCRAGLTEVGCLPDFHNLHHPLAALSPRPMCALVPSYCTYHHCR